MAQIYDMGPTALLPLSLVIQFKIAHTFFAVESHSLKSLKY